MFRMKLSTTDDWWVFFLPLSTLYFSNNLAEKKRKTSGFAWQYFSLHNSLKALFSLNIKKSKSEKVWHILVVLLVTWDLSRFHYENHLELLSLPLHIERSPPSSKPALNIGETFPWHLNVCENMCVLSSHFFQNCFWG